MHTLYTEPGGDLINVRVYLHLDCGASHEVRYRGLHLWHRHIGALKDVDLGSLPISGLGMFTPRLRYVTESSTNTWTEIKAVCKNNINCPSRPRGLAMPCNEGKNGWSGKPSGQSHGQWEGLRRGGEPAVCLLSPTAQSPRSPVVSPAVLLGQCGFFPGYLVTQDPYWLLRSPH